MHVAQYKSIVEWQRDAHMQHIQVPHCKLHISCPAINYKTNGKYETNVLMH